MHQIAILKTMLQKPYFLKYYPILSKLKNTPIEHQLILKSMYKYFNEYGDKDLITIDEMQAYFQHQNPGLKNPDGYNVLFTQLRDVRIENEELIDDIFVQVLETFYCASIATEAISVVESQKASAMDEIENLAIKFREDVGKVNDIEEDFCNLSLDELMDEEMSGGIPWHLQFLNDTLGLLKRGTLGHVFARPNAGKTSLAINIACNAAARFELAKTDDTILYLCNEEKVDSLKIRAYTAFTNHDVKWVNANRAASMAVWEKLGGDRIKMIDGVIHIAQVERYLKHVQPTVTIIDQGAKVSIYNRDITGPERLQQLYNMLRNKAKDHNTSMITLGQASETAENKKWLKLNMMDNSKVGVPGELDWALGIGFIENENGLRYLNIAKKKRGKFGRSAVAFSEDTGKYSNS